LLLNVANTSHHQHHCIVLVPHLLDPMWPKFWAQIPINKVRVA
jgi:hypothetical protein